MKDTVPNEMSELLNKLIDRTNEIHEENQKSNKNSDRKATIAMIAATISAIPVIFNFIKYLINLFR